MCYAYSVLMSQLLSMFDLFDLHIALLELSKTYFSFVEFGLLSQD